MLRTCIGCGQVDDHPRHVVDVGGVDTLWHHDCHAISAGCEVCQAVSAQGLKGDELRDHIVANDPGQEVVDRQVADRDAAAQSQEG